MKTIRTGDDVTSSNLRNRFFTKRFLSQVFSLTVFAAIFTTSCAMPSYVTSIDSVLEQEGRDNGIRYRYRCSAGAHRGASVEHMENTMAALKAADADNRYVFIEFDVQYSKDGRIVVYHDKRMLRLHGSIRPIGDATFAELSEITHGEIAAFDEVMGTLKKKLNVEIKSRGDEQEDRRLVDEIMADIRSRKRERDVMISSISKDVIRYVNQRYPDMATGQVLWLTLSTYLHFDTLTEKLYADICATQADYILLHVANLRNIDDLIKLKPKNKTIMFWDFDDTIYIVHKDMSDRVWGDSGMKTFLRFVQYELVSLLR